MSAYEDNYNGTAIHLITGTEFDYNDPAAAELTLHDFAHALGRITRYGGHIAAPHYSVAEHAIIVATLVYKHYNQPELALAALHHDDAEALGTGDIPTPLKNYMKEQGFDFRKFERGLKVAVSNTFNIPLDQFSAGVIKDADVLAYAAECEVLKPEGHGALPEVEPELLEEVKGMIMGLDPATAEQMYTMFHTKLSSPSRTEQMNARADEMLGLDGPSDDAPADPFAGEDPYDPRG